MSRNHVIYELADFLEGNLSKEEVSRVQAHLESCAECRRELDELKETLTILSAQTWDEPSRSYFSLLFPSIMRSLEKKSERKGQPVLQYLLQVVALLLIVMVGYTSLPDMNNIAGRNKFVDTIQNEEPSVINDETIFYQKEFSEILGLYLTNQLSDSLVIQSAIINGQPIAFHSSVDEEQFYETLNEQAQGVLVDYLEERM